MRTHKTLKLLSSLYLVVFINCSTESQENNSSKIDLGFNSYLYFEDNNSLNSQRNLIENKLRETVSLVNTKMPTETINFRVRVSSSNVIPEIGIGGFNPNANEIILSFDPNFHAINQSIDLELGPMIAHEMHHAKRRRSVGYGTSLLQAIITEGLADSFSLEIFDINPPMWSTALSSSELDHWIETASAEWLESTYNHSKWFYGTSSEIPRWTGYSIGFKLVQDFLIQNPSTFPSNLVNQPASTFIE